MFVINRLYKEHEQKQQNNEMNQTDGQQALYKIVCIGDSGVGKTNLITRFTRDKFFTNSKSTIGVDFATKSINQDGVEIKAQILDTAGQDRFRAVATTYYRGAHAVLLVYDITDHKSFDNLETWLKEASNHCRDNCVYMLVGNKCDLGENRSVTIDEAKKFAEKKSIRFFETSAANKTNVEEAFNALMVQTHKANATGLSNRNSGTHIQQSQPQLDRGIRITDDSNKPVTPQDNDNQPKKGGCC
jgi:small GTP-binding protein